MKSVLHVKVDPTVKKAAQKAASDLGLPLSIVVNENLRRFAEERTILFAAARPMSRSLERRLGRIISDCKAGRNLSPVFSSMEEGIAYLHE